MKSWVYEKGNYYYISNEGTYYKNNIFYINCSYYGFDITGKLLTGYQTINGEKYCFSLNGSAKIGWVWNKALNGYQYFDPENRGAAVTGFKKISKNYYYFAQNGVEVRNQFKIIKDKLYYFGIQGTYISSWFYRDGNAYYVGEDGVCYTNGTYKIDNKKYLFNNNGNVICN